MMHSDALTSPSACSAMHSGAMSSSCCTCSFKIFIFSFALLILVYYFYTVGSTISLCAAASIGNVPKTLLARFYNQVVLYLI